MHGPAHAWSDSDQAVRAVHSSKSWLITFFKLKATGKLFFIFLHHMLMTGLNVQIKIYQACHYIKHHFSARFAKSHWNVKESQLISISCVFGILEYKAELQ